MFRLGNRKGGMGYSMGNRKPPSGVRMGERSHSAVPTVPRGASGASSQQGLNNIGNQMFHEMPPAGLGRSVISTRGGSGIEKKGRETPESFKKTRYL